MERPKGALGRVIISLIISGIALWLVPGIIVLCNLHNDAIRHKAIPFIIAGFVLGGIGNILLAAWRIKTGGFFNQRPKR